MSDNKFQLKRELGLFSATCIVIGSIIGTGIFVTPGGLLLSANGHVGLCLILWVICGIIELFGGLCFAELGTCIPESGGMYVFLHRTFGSYISYVFLWTSCVLIQGFAVSITALSFGTYCKSLFIDPDCQHAKLASKFLAVFILFTIAAIHYYSVKKGIMLQNILVGLKILILVLISISGLIYFMKYGSQTNNFKISFKDKKLQEITFTRIGLGLYQGLYAFDGWNNLTYITEEVRKPSRNVILAILLGVLCVTIVYLMVNIGYLAVLELEDIMISDTVATKFSQIVLGPFARAIPITICLSLAGVLYCQYMAYTRLIFSAARNGHLPKICSMIHIKYFTPTPTCVWLTFVSTLIISLGDIGEVINAANFTAWVFYGLSALSIIVLRIKYPNLKRPFKNPIFVPVIVVLLAICLVIAPLVDKPKIIYIFSVIVILCGLGVHYLFIQKKIRLKCVDSLTLWLQKLLQVTVTDWEKDTLK